MANHGFRSLSFKSLWDFTKKGVKEKKKSAKADFGVNVKRIGQTHIPPFNASCIFLVSWRHLIPQV